VYVLHNIVSLDTTRKKEGNASYFCGISPLLSDFISKAEYTAFSDKKQDKIRFFPKKRFRLSATVKISSVVLYLGLKEPHHSFKAFSAILAGTQLR